MSPRFGIKTQRRLVDMLSITVPAIGGVRTSHLSLNGVATHRLDSTRESPGQAYADQHTAAVLYLHGGGFVLGSAWSYRALTSRLARWSGLPVFVPEYRLAPEHPHPAQLSDALACVEALQQMGWPTNRLIVAGDSAGGNLGLALTQALIEKGLSVPRALALISPWADVTATGNHEADDAIIDPRWVAMLRPLIGPQHLLPTAAVSPLNGSFEQFPPTLIQSAAGEVLAPVIKALVARMQAHRAPVSWTEAPGLWHDFQLHAGTVPEATQALRRMSNFIVEYAEQAP